jgi:hypothetical protein
VVDVLEPLMCAVKNTCDMPGVDAAELVPVEIDGATEEVCTGVTCMEAMRSPVAASGATAEGTDTAKLKGGTS